MAKFTYRQLSTRAQVRLFGEENSHLFLLRLPGVLAHAAHGEGPVDEFVVPAGVGGEALRAVLAPAHLRLLTVFQSLALKSMACQFLPTLPTNKGSGEAKARYWTRGTTRSMEVKASSRTRTRMQRIWDRSSLSLYVVI